MASRAAYPSNPDSQPRRRYAPRLSAERFPPERYERFVGLVSGLLWPPDASGH
jgi:hypothetical protein